MSVVGEHASGPEAVHASDSAPAPLASRLRRVGERETPNWLGSATKPLLRELFAPPVITPTAGHDESSQGGRQLEEARAEAELEALS